MAIDSYFNRDREDDDDNYYEITDREKRILNSPPPRFYDPRIEGFPDWNARQQE